MADWHIAALFVHLWLIVHSAWERFVYLMLEAFFGDDVLTEDEDADREGWI